MVLAAEALAVEAESQTLAIDGAPHKGVFYQLARRRARPKAGDASSIRARRR